MESATAQTMAGVHSTNYNETIQTIHHGSTLQGAAPVSVYSLSKIAFYGAIHIIM